MAGTLPGIPHDPSGPELTRDRDRDRDRDRANRSVRGALCRLTVAMMISLSVGLKCLMVAKHEVRVLIRLCVCVHVPGAAICKLQDTLYNVQYDILTPFAAH